MGLWPYRERKSAGESAQIAASDPVSPGKHVLFSRVSRRPANSRDWLAARPVWSKPLSGAELPVYREFTGKPIENQAPAAMLKRKRTSAVRSLAANSLVLETGNLRGAEQGRSDAPREQNREASEASKEDDP